MTLSKSHIQLSALLFLFSLSNVSLADESAISENKTNSTNSTTSNSDISVTVDTQTQNAPASFQQQQVNDSQPMQNREQRHRQMQEAQMETYKRFLENRKRQSSAYLPVDVQNRRNEYIKQMEQRRTLIRNMMDERRKAAQEKRKTMLQKMHQTSTASAIAEKA